MYLSTLAFFIPLSIFYASKAFIWYVCWWSLGPEICVEISKTFYRMFLAYIYSKIVMQFCPRIGNFWNIANCRYTLVNESPWCAIGRRWATWVWSGSSISYKCKTYENLICVHFGQIYEICTNKNFPLYNTSCPFGV